MSEQEKNPLGYSLDFIFCIDESESMESCIESVKRSVDRFVTDCFLTFDDNGLMIENIRVKTIVFRDYKSDGQNAMIESRFYEFPQKEGEFFNYLDGIKPSGGCKEGTNGLEALYLAMKSDFSDSKKSRQIIVLFTDSDAITLELRKDCDSYPCDMVDDEGLLATWGCVEGYKTKLKERSKRLVMFAPRNTYYEEMSRIFNRSIFVPIDIHKGLDDFSFNDICCLTAASSGSC